MRQFIQVAICTAMLIGCANEYPSDNVGEAEFGTKSGALSATPQAKFRGVQTPSRFSVFLPKSGGEELSVSKVVWTVAHKQTGTILVSRTLDGDRVQYRDSDIDVQIPRSFDGIDVVVSTAVEYIDGSVEKHDLDLPSKSVGTLPIDGKSKFATSKVLSTDDIPKK